MAMISSAEIQASVSTSSGSPTILVMIGIPRGRLTVVKSLRDGNDEIYVMDTDGSNQINISRSAAGDAWPSWSPVR
jgi:Tol biopolymer transport system component